MRPGESEEDYKKRVARLSASRMVKLYLDEQARYMTADKIEHDGPVVAKHWRNVNRRYAAKWMVKTWLLR